MSEYGEECKRVEYEIASVTLDLELIELKILLMIAKRLKRGQDEIGILSRDDGRVWIKEEAEEFFDAAVYRMLRLLKEEP